MKYPWFEGLSPRVHDDVCTLTAHARGSEWDKQSYRIAHKRNVQRARRYLRAVGLESPIERDK